MGEVTLKVPAEFAGMFRSAIVAEIGMDADWVKSGHEELCKKRLRWDHVDEPVFITDIQGAVNALAEVLSIAQQAFATKPDKPLALKGSREAFAHMCETMASKIVSPRIAEETDTTPFDASAKASISGFVKALSWATNEATRLHDEWLAEWRKTKASV